MPEIIEGADTRERELFEAAMAKEGYHCDPQRYRDNSYRDSDYAAGWAMWQAGRASISAPAPVAAEGASTVEGAGGVPEGWVLVPKNPTGPMRVAGGAAVMAEYYSGKKPPGDDDVDTACTAYEAMIAAIPAPPSTPTT